LTVLYVLTTTNVTGTKLTVEKFSFEI
jgi:hypothetical protein